MKKLPKIVIVGRVNVGKSTLFNRLAQRVKSLVLDYEGLTRDTVQDTMIVDGMACQIVDTAGIGTVQESARESVELAHQSQQKTYEQVGQADLILFVVDGSAGLMPQERDFARWLHAQHKPVIMVVNKTDRADSQLYMHEFALGFSQVCPISAAHGIGMPELLDHIVGYLKKSFAGGTSPRAVAEPPACAIMLLGKPNAGKSRLMNALLGYERTLVSDVAGTTREAISERIVYYQEPFEVIDTPGVRKKASVSGQVEPHMVHTTFQALTHADIVMVVIDATDGQLLDQVLKLAFYAFQDRFKAVMLVLTKWDLVTPSQVRTWDEHLKEYAQLTSKVPVFKVSGLTGKNVGKLIPAIKELCERYHQVLDGRKLYALFQTHLAHKPLVRNKIILSITQVMVTGSAPVTLTITVPEPRLWEPSHVAFLERLVRSEYNMLGVPIKFILVKQD